MVVHPFRFRLAHRALAAFRAISFRRLAEIVLIRTFADLRPIAAKYSDSFLSIIIRIVYAAVEHVKAVVRRWTQNRPRQKETKSTVSQSPYLNRRGAV
jgi:hypothetical protein